MYQLKGAVHPRYKQEELMYDAVGNLLSYRLNGESYRFSYDSLYQLTEEKGIPILSMPFITDGQKMRISTNSMN